MKSVCVCVCVWVGEYHVKFCIYLFILFYLFIVGKVQPWFFLQRHRIWSCLRRPRRFRWIWLLLRLRQLAISQLNYQTRKNVKNKTLKCNKKKFHSPIITNTWLNSANDNIPFWSLSYNLRPSIKSSKVPQVFSGIL